MDQTLITQLGDELYQALTTRSVLDPLTARHPELTIEHAYRIQQRMIERRVEAGERIIGKKIGVTSRAVMNMLGVYQPDFGYMLDGMIYNEGESVPIATLIQPKAEGEIAFILKKDLMGPGVTNAEVLAATECVMPCFEIVDSRIRDWKISIVDTIADNGSSGAFVLGDSMARADGLDLRNIGMVLEKNGEVIATGAGAAALGHPLTCVTWLANKLGEFGIGLKAGEVILSGSLAIMFPVQPGDHVSMTLSGLGSCRARFTA
jgi:2-oxopent-4-enoate/cis-2-oxohex-4-enoate hydratase